MFVVTTGDFNPLTMRKTARQKQIKYVAEQKAEIERRKLNKKNLENLLKLRKEILKKAENLDGRAGLTFIEQADLARKLGYEGMLLEGRIDNFGLEVSINKYYQREPQTYLHINKDKIKISEESLKSYLEKQ